MLQEGGFDPLHVSLVMRPEGASKQQCVGTLMPFTPLHGYQQLTSLTTLLRDSDSGADFSAVKAGLFCFVFVCTEGILC